jgi:hypothetical protein
MVLLKQATDTSGMSQVELDELWELVCNVTTNYQRTYRDQDTFQVLAQELTFAIQISTKTGYTGTIDLVYLDNEGRVRFMDHKTTTSLDKYEKNAAMDRQISRYWWALQQLQAGKGYIKLDGEWRPVSETVFGLQIKGREIGPFTYNIVLKDYPVPPNFIKPDKKTGKPNISKDKAQKTTYELYVKALLQAGLATETLEGQIDAPGYEDFLTYLLETPKEFFRRVEVMRNQAEIDASIKEFFYTVKDLNQIRSVIENPKTATGEPVDAPIYRNITADCSWDCPFRDVCVAGFDGSNVNLLLNTLFTKGERQ